MKSLTEYITEAEQIAPDTIAGAAVKSMTALRSLLNKNGFECSKIDKTTDVPSEVRGTKVVSGDRTSFKISKGDDDLGSIIFKNYKLKHYITRESDVFYQMRFVPDYTIKLDDGYESYELMCDLSKKKHAESDGCKHFADFLLKY